VESLSHGLLPWRMSWTCSQTPREFPSGKPFSGTNLFILGLQSLCPYWIDAALAHHMGLTIEGPPVWILKRPMPVSRLRACAMRPVYSLQQIMEHIAFDWPAVAGTVNLSAKVEQIIAEYPNRPRIAEGPQKTQYNWDIDTIIMRSRYDWIGDGKPIEQYYYILFHELIHSTGHKSRLNRPDMKLTKNQRHLYGREELTAEIGAGLLMHAARFGCGAESSPTVIRSWIEALTRNPGMIVPAFHNAERAVRYILNQPEETNES
jgi:antirestriction protein ArdC